MSETVEKEALNLMEWLKTVGMSVEFFASVLEIDKSYVYKMIKGTCIPSADLMKKIKKITRGKISKPENLRK